MNRNAALLLMLAAVGLFVAEMMVKGDAWHITWLPRAVRIAVDHGSAEIVTLLAGLAGAYLWLRDRPFHLE